MIAYLQGQIQKKLPRAVILNAGNVGYLVNVPLPVEQNLKEKDETELFIFTRVREDDISLYGFETLDQLDFFKTLLGVNGVGAKMAMDILGEKTETVKTAILSGDIAYLCKIPGIGKKTAERIIVELKNKINVSTLLSVAPSDQHDIDNDAIIALISLGYQRYEINRVLKTMPDEIDEAEKIVTYFLQNV